jgi:hypothetical protein
VQLFLTPLQGGDKSIDVSSVEISELADVGDRFARVVRATCRITVSGVCGSGTVVGRDSDGNAIVLTNAHVAGTQRGRQVQVQRWDTNGESEKGNGAIIAAGYGRGLSIDFALLKCNAGFAKDVVPIPLADRYPDVAAGVSTYGCPRCEWPSMQVLKLTRAEGQVLRWLPEAIGGRSGSSVVDYTESGPRVVGLLTWGGGGEGLGQSTPFLLNAMRGQMPKSFESLPVYAQELSANTANLPVRKMPCGLDGQILAFTSLTSADETEGATDGSVIDSILEDGPDKPDADEGTGIFRDRDPDKTQPAGPIAKLGEWFRRVIITVVVAAGAGAAGYLLGRLRS